MPKDQILNWLFLKFSVMLSGELLLKDDFTQYYNCLMPKLLFLLVSLGVFSVKFGLACFFVCFFKNIFFIFNQVVWNSALCIQVLNMISWSLTNILII